MEEEEEEREDRTTRPGDFWEGSWSAGQTRPPADARPARAGLFFPRGVRRSIDSQSAAAAGRDRTSRQGRPGWSK